MLTIRKEQMKALEAARQQSLPSGSKPSSQDKVGTQDSAGKAADVKTLGKQTGAKDWASRPGIAS